MNDLDRLPRIALVLQLSAVALVTVGLVVLAVLTGGEPSTNGRAAKTVALGLGLALAGAGIVVSRRSDRGAQRGQAALTVIGGVCLTFLATFVLWRRASGTDSSPADIGSGFVLLVGLTTFACSALAHWFAARRAQR